jgi:hypothetical protein
MRGVTFSNLAELTAEWIDTDEVVPRSVPGWHVIDENANGRRFVHPKTKMIVIATASQEADGKRWLHVSCSFRNRLPNWAELRMVKDAFIGKERTALQILPPEAEHVNIHPFCLHLWSCLDGDVTPDFRFMGMI